MVEKPQNDTHEKHEFDYTCINCGALLPQSARTCLVCGSMRNKVAFGGAFANTQTVPLPEKEEYKPVQSSARERRTLDRWRKFGTAFTSIVLVAILSVAGVLVYDVYFDTSNYSANQSVVYQQSDGLVMLSYPGLEQPVEVSGIPKAVQGLGSAALYPSPNGRWLMHKSSDGALRVMDFASLRRRENSDLQATLLSDNIKSEPMFTKSGRYAVYINKKKELEVTNFQEKWLLDTGVAEIIAVSDDYALYTRIEESGLSRDLYLGGLRKSSGEYLLITRNVGEVLDWTDSLEKIVYTGITRHAGNDVYKLQTYLAETSSTVVMAENVSRVLDASAANDTAFYLTANSPRWRFDTFVDDEFASGDLLIIEPDLADYPLLQSFIDIYGDQEDVSAYELSEEIVEQDRRYRDSLRQWNEKVERDKTREQYRHQLLNTAEKVVLYDLYAYKSGISTAVDTGVWINDGRQSGDGEIDAEYGYILYEKIDHDSLDKVKISSLTGESDKLNSFRKYYLDNTSVELSVGTLSGATRRMYAYTKNRQAGDWMASPKWDGIYFTIEDSGGGSGGADTTELYFSPIQNGTVQDAIIVETGVQQMVSPFKEGIIYKSGQADSALVQYVRSGAVQTIGNARVVLGSVNSIGSVTYLDQYDAVSKSGSLYLYNKQSRLISSDVVDYTYYSDDLIYYQKNNESTTSGRSVYRWQNGRETLLDYDALHILPVYHAT